MPLFPFIALFIKMDSKGSVVFLCNRADKDGRLLKRGSKRQNFMEFMRGKGIPTSIHYPPVHTFSHYRSCDQPGSLPITDAAGARVVTLPLYPDITREQLEYVIEALKQWSILFK
jgi:dTDP-4-amino-4,6-dideoxygalactose transaminase